MIAANENNPTTGKRSILNRLSGGLLSYDAASTSKKRRDPPASLKSTDAILTPQKRKTITSATRDAQRNFSIAGWAIRRHLDYVSTFSFQARTGNPELDTEIENLVRWWSRPLNFDIAGRHSLPRFVRMLEERRVVDGDVFVMKLANGRVQAIESDRVRNPTGKDNENKKRKWTHGIDCAPGGRARAYALHDRRDSGGYDFSRIVRSGNIFSLAYYDRFDQVRGVSPLAAAVNTLRDCYEGFDLALAKAKVSQLFAMSIYRESEFALGDVTEDEANDSVGDGGKYSVDFGKGPIKLELDAGDRTEFHESNQPSSEFQAFTETMIGASLKALDIPSSFYSEKTNFAGTHAARLQYDQTCQPKRRDLREFLDQLTTWRLNLFVANGTLTLPAGMTPGDMRFEWISAGFPYWNPVQETKSDIEQINAGLRTRTEIRKRRFGDDWKDVAMQLKEEEDYLNELGISTPALLGTAGTGSVE